jgi:preprotein translocase subunit YajC
MFFNDVAYAMGAGQGTGGEGASNPLAAFLPLILMFAIFYFLLIRPQQKKAKQHKMLLSNLQKGDHVLTGGGIYGRITNVAGDVLTIEIAKDMSIKVNRNYVSGKAEPGETKAE